MRMQRNQGYQWWNRGASETSNLNGETDRSASCWLKVIVPGECFSDPRPNLRIDASIYWINWSDEDNKNTLSKETPYEATRYTKNYKILDILAPNSPFFLWDGKNR